MERITNVTRTGNTISVLRMDHPRCSSDFISNTKDAIRAGYSEIVVIFEYPDRAVFPNACVPIAAAINNFKVNSNVDFQMELPYPDSMLESTHLLSPLLLSVEEIEQLTSPMNIVIQFCSYEQVFAFTQRCVNYISQQTACEEGTLDGLIWCINEVMDNVTVHSGCPHGYVMAQYHKQTNRIAICVADSGIGIYNSLKDTKHHPRTHDDSLSLAVQEGIGDGKGQGNGLFGLYQIIRSNKGSLTLTSSGASIMLTNAGIEKKFERIPVVNFSTPGTVVDFQMDLNRKVDLQSAFSTIGGHDSIDFEIESMMDENDVIQYDVFEHCQGTATREAGRLLRNDVLNTITRANAPICLDFSKVATVSSSFIDEFLSKMIIGLGIIHFSQTVSIKNMNDTVRFLCERSTYMRIHDEWISTKDSQQEISQ